MIPNYHENEFAKFWIQNGILFFEYKPDVIVHLAAAQCIVADRIRIQHGKAYPVFCDIRGVVDSDKDGRDYLAQYGSVLTKAVCLVAYQNVSLILISFYLKICKPKVPTRLFTDETAGLAFLETYI
jgi:hypothetical protein